MSKTECDVTVTEDMDISVSLSDAVSYENCTYLQSAATPKAVTPSAENITVCKNILQYIPGSLKHVENTDRKVFVNRIYNDFEEKPVSKKEGNLSRSSSLYEKDTINPNKNLSTAGSSKWSTEKEKFLESTRNLEIAKAQYLERNIDMLKNLNIESEKSKISKDCEFATSKIKAGAVVIKEKYIEPPKVTRVSRSFHGKSSITSGLDSTCSPRRASDSMSVVSVRNEKDIKTSSKRKTIPQLPQTGGSSVKSTSQYPENKKNLPAENVVKPRFTTTIVDEAEHAASVGLRNYQKKNEGGLQRSHSDTE